MATKIFLDSNDLRTKVRSAMVEMATLVGATLGPGGRPILIDQEGAPPLATKDGVTVATHFKGGNSISSIVTDAAKEVCERTARIAGDGTTTAIVLAAALVDSGHSFLADSGQYGSPQKLAREMRDFFENVVKKDIQALIKPIKGLPPEEANRVIRSVALVSANHDNEIASAVLEAVNYVGEDGMIIAEEGTGTKTSVVHKDGFPCNSGLLDLGPSAGVSFVNKKGGMETVLEGSYVAMFDGEINDFNAITPILEQVASEQYEGRLVKAPILIIAHDFSDQVLRLLAQNFRRGTITVVPFVTPRNGQAYYKQQFLHDLRAYVGGKVFDAQSKHIKDATLPELGFTEMVKIAQRDTVFLTSPEVDEVTKRIEELKSQMDGASEFDKDKLRYRIGQLTGGVATIYAGGTTAFEAKERHARLVDAISAVRSAVDQGVIPGGGAALATLSLKYGGSTDAVSSLIAKAIIQPFLNILSNAGMRREDLENTLRGIGDKDGTFMVYDALSHKFVDWYNEGIMDPSKVTLTALDNAISVAQLMITLGGIVVTSLSKDEKQVRSMQEGLIKAINQGEV